MTRSVRQASSHAILSALVGQVMSNADLVSHVFGFLLLGESGRQGMRRLGQLSLVCRRWRHVCEWEQWWEPIEGEIVPVLWRTRRPGTQSRPRHNQGHHQQQQHPQGQEVVRSARGAVVQHGQRVLDEKRVWGGDDWAAWLSVHFEVFDRADGLQVGSRRARASSCRCCSRLVGGKTHGRPVFAKLP